MHAFALGYAVALAGSFAAWAVAARPRQRPDPVDWAQEAPGLALCVLCVFAFGWALVAGSLSQMKQTDIRAKFRAADPCGWWTFAAGTLSGLAAIGLAVLAHRVFEPSGEERDLNTIRAGLASFASVAFAWLAGAGLFLALFHPRPGAP